jgi:hypothetical protein
MRIVYLMAVVPVAALIAWTFAEYLSPSTMLALLTGAAFCK